MPRQADRDTGIPISPFVAVKSRLRELQRPTATPESNNSTRGAFVRQQQNASTTFSEAINDATKTSQRQLPQSQTKATNNSNYNDVTDGIHEEAGNSGAEILLKTVAALKNHLNDDELYRIGPADMTATEQAIAINIKFLRAYIRVNADDQDVNITEMQKMILVYFEELEDRIERVKVKMANKDRRHARIKEIERFKMEIERRNREVEGGKMEGARTKRVNEWRAGVKPTAATKLVLSKRGLDVVEEVEKSRAGSCSKRRKVIKEEAVPSEDLPPLGYWEECDDGEEYEEDEWDEEEEEEEEDEDEEEEYEYEYEDDDNSNPSRNPFSHSTGSNIIHTQHKITNKLSYIALVHFMLLESAKRAKQRALFSEKLARLNAQFNSTQPSGCVVRNKEDSEGLARMLEELKRHWD